jgi:hypothetical protein
VEPPGFLRTAELAAIRGPAVRHAARRPGGAAVVEDAQLHAQRVARAASARQDARALVEELRSPQDARAAVCPGPVASAAATSAVLKLGRIPSVEVARLPLPPEVDGHFSGGASPLRRSLAWHIVCRERVAEELSSLFFRHNLRCPPIVSAGDAAHRSLEAGGASHDAQVGLGRGVALHRRSSTLYRICEEIRCLSF